MNEQYVNKNNEVKPHDCPDEQKGCKPLVSVIIACHNAYSYIDECLESLVKQTYPHFEMIICDDASSDNSWSKLRKWSEADRRTVLLRNEKNMGAGYTRNRCLEAASGDFLMIQDIDDYSSPQRIELLLDALTKEPGIDFVSSLMQPFGQDGSPSRVLFEGKGRRKEHPSKWDFLWVLPFAHATTMFRREVLTSIKGYRIDAQVNRQEDYEMMMRAYAHGYRGKNLDIVLYFYRYDISNIGRIQGQGLSNYAKVRFQGFKAMGLLPWGLPFVLKPYFAHLYHLVLLRKKRLAV